jgi:hypothetical protein
LVSGSAQLITDARPFQAASHHQPPGLGCVCDNRRSYQTGLGEQAIHPEITNAMMIRIAISVFGDEGRWHGLGLVQVVAGFQ